MAENECCLQFLFKNELSRWKVKEVLVESSKDTVDRLWPFCATGESMAPVRTELLKRI